MAKNDELEVRSDGVYWFDYSNEKYYKVSDRPSSHPNSEYYERKRREAEERREINALRQQARRESADRYARELEERRERAIAAEEAELEKKKEHYKAYEEASERYYQKSRLWRFFHKSFTKTAEGLSTEQLNDLYQQKKK